MKRYCKNFKFTKEFITASILECLYHKTGKCVRWYRRDTSYFLAEYLIKGKFVSSENLDDVAFYVWKNIEDLLSWIAKDVVPYIAECMLEEIANRHIELKPIQYQLRLDSSSLKEREIGITSIKQQVYDYIAVNACKEMFMSKIGKYQCSSLPNRGQLYCKKYIEKCIRKKSMHSRYVIKFDIKKCYPSIKHSKLFEKLERDIKNKDVVFLLEALITTYSDNGQGLCIGTYLSQYLANYYLSYLWHFIQENLFVTRKSKRNNRTYSVKMIKYSAFYMDDVILIGSNKKYMKTAMKYIKEYLSNEMELELKNDQYQVIDMCRPKAFIDIVGYRIYRRYTIIRERIFNKIKQGIKKLHKYGEMTFLSVCKSFMSRHGYVKYSNSLNFKKRNSYSQLFNIARKAVSNETRMLLHRTTTKCVVSAN